MGSLIRAAAWRQTAPGPVASWPQSLRSAVSICLGSRFPIVIYWGPSLLTFYNDAYAPILAHKHPWALGRPCSEVWAEIWDVIGPQLDDVRRTGAATWSDDQLLVLRRRGYPEECYFSFSFGPLRDERGDVSGVFTAVTENTQRVLGERRLQTLRDLGARSTESKSVADACRITADILGRSGADIPYSLLYLLDHTRNVARLAGVSGLQSGAPGAPETAALDADDASVPWPLATAARCRDLVVLENVTDRITGLPGGPWPDAPRTAVMKAIATAGQERPVALLIAGVSPRRMLDSDYRAFFELIAGHAASALANAGAYEAERRRAEALAELDRAKTVFFNDVSHEFRTPLTLMLGPLEELLHDPRYGAPPDLRLQLDVIRRNALRLQKLVNTLLDFSRLEAGRIEAAYQPTDLPALTAQLASMFESAVHRADLRLVVDCPPGSEPAWVDREMWEKIVMNLVSNAFKFTLRGEIRVAVAETADGFTLIVRDTGVGIPVEEMPRLFERFHRIRHAEARTHEGTGIGLAQVHELVRLHGGEIDVRSEPGRGTEFTVRIPRGSAHLPADHIDAQRQLPSTAVGANAFVEEALRWLPDDEDAGDRMIRDGDHASTHPRRSLPCVGARILIADDNADMRDYLRCILGRYWTVEVAPDGAVALGMAKERAPELIVCDVMMPGLDGFELLRALRTDESTRAIPVILLSARAGEESAAEALEAGADAYLVKPFAERELVAYVGGHLQLHRLRREAQLALAASEAKFAAAFEQSPLALTITSLEDGRLVEVNEGFLRLSGYTRDEALGRTAEELGLWVDSDLRTAGIERLRAGERISHGEARFRTKNGEIRIGTIGAARIEIGNRPHVLSSVVDVTGQAQAREQLAAANARLMEADRRKDEFLAMLGHELRNPLAAVSNAIATVIGDPARGRRALDIASRQAEQLGRLIDDLLDVARITHGRISLRKEPVSLAEVLERAVDNTRPFLDSRGLRLDVSPMPAVLVDADPTRLEQVFANLLSNAGKYTDPGGAISLSVEPSDTRATIRVRDTGIGIPPQMLPRIWDLFCQAERSLDRSEGGLGIGLTITRRLVELHGGRVEAHSEGSGRGAEFVVELPALPAAAEPARADSSVARTASSIARVLVVEDNPDAAESLAMLLELSGHRVRAVHDGPTALDAARADVPDVMLVDIGLPGMDGYELARRVRLDPLLGRVTLVALTGYGRDEDKASAIASGFDDHLVKPIDPDVLNRLVRRVGSTIAG